MEAKAQTAPLVPYGPHHEKTCLRGFENNNDSDQPAHLGSLISSFVCCILESIISRLAKSKILIFWLVYIAEQAGLNLALQETPKTGFVATAAHIVCNIGHLRTKETREQTKKVVTGRKSV